MPEIITINPSTDTTATNNATATTTVTTTKPTTKTTKPTTTTKTTKPTPTPGTYDVTAAIRKGIQDHLLKIGKPSTSKDVDAMLAQLKTEANRIARAIYDAKGAWLYDNEEDVLPALSMIATSPKYKTKNNTEQSIQYAFVNSYLTGLTKGRAIGPYLKSFMDDKYLEDGKVASKLKELGAADYTQKLVTVSTATTSAGSEWIGDAIFYFYLFSGIGGPVGVAIRRITGRPWFRASYRNPKYMSRFLERNPLMFSDKAVFTGQSAKLIRRMYKSNLITRDEAVKLLEAIKKDPMVRRHLRNQLRNNFEQMISQNTKMARPAMEILYKDGIISKKQAYKWAQENPDAWKTDAEWLRQNKNFESYLNKLKGLGNEDADLATKMGRTGTTNTLSGKTSTKTTTTGTKTTTPRKIYYSQRFANITPAQFKNLSDKQKRYLNDYPYKTYDEVLVATR